MTEIKKVGIIGLGALGLLFAKEMTENHADVSIIVDEGRAAKYSADGMFVNDERVELHYVTPAQAETMDLILFCTKIGGLAEAMETAAPFVGKETLLLSVLNGITSEEMLSERFGAENVLYATAQGMDATKDGNRLFCKSTGMIMLGEKESGPVSARAQMVTDFLMAHGVRSEAVCDMVRRQWSKLMLNDGVNQVCMVYEGTYATIHAPGEARDMMIAAMRETQALAKLEGYIITDEELNNWVALMDSLAPEGMPSMRQDGLAKRKSEVELFSGTVIRRAAKFGLPVPVNEHLYKTVLEMEAQY